MTKIAKFIRRAGLVATAGMQISLALHAQGAPAPAPAASTAKAAATAPTAPAPRPEPVVPPSSVPAEVNPFADDSNLPTPLKWPNALRPRIDVDVTPIHFDGYILNMMMFKGPDFVWQLQPLDDFALVRSTPSESVAFLYQPRPVVRISIALYAPGELLPDFTPASLAQYLAAIRAPAPKSFVLMTPFPKDTKFIQPEGIGGFQAQSLDYAIVSDVDVIIHHDVFLDLHQEYLLVASIVGPPSLVDKLKPTLHRLLNNSRVLKGLGVKEQSSDTSNAPANAPVIPQ